MTFHTARIGAIACFRVAGVFGAGEDFRNLDAAVGRACLLPVGALVIDMAKVTILDCTGIGELLRLRGRVSTSGRRVGLVNVNPRHQRIIEMARLAAALGLHDSTVRKPIRSHCSLVSVGDVGASRRIGLALV